MKKRIRWALLLCTSILLTGCQTEGGKTESAGEIYFLNFKPEIAEVYERIAETYREETGVTVKVVTAASNTYETTLKAEMAKSDAPTIFQINGPVGYQSWKDYCADLRGTALYSFLSDKSLAVTDGDSVYGIPYVVEGYGIIYNDAIMQKYFELKERGTTIMTMEEIRDFETLKAVVEDMTAHKEELGIEGVFASTSMSAGEEWRWQSHLANVPFYYEFLENNAEESTILTGLQQETVEFRYAENYKNLFDLYIQNSCVPPTLIGSRSVSDSMAEFALGKAAMVQNGNWAWSLIDEVDGNIVEEDDIHMLPLYTGMEGEETQGLCIGTENYFAINSKASSEKQALSVAFLEWLFSSDTGKAYVTNDLDFITPFNTFTEDERPDDPLAREIASWLSKDAESVEWTFASFPSETFKRSFSDALLEYAQGSKPWEDVVSAVKQSWKTEYTAARG